MVNIYKEKVILSCADPIITSYPHHACYMSVLGNEEKYTYAILDAYIPLAYNATYKRLDFSIGVDIVEFMENLPFLEAEYLTRKEFIEGSVSYVNHIKGAIANGFYVYLLIDYYFVSADKDAYLQKHRIHDVFIYGFDDVNHAFLAKDFLNGRKYMGFLVSYVEMEKACDVDLEKDWLRGIKMYRRKTVIHEEISFHPWVIRKEILDYREAKQKGFCLRAHVGEFGTWKNIMHVINVLELDEVNHGISICNEKSAMRYCADQGIWFHVCPSSNIMMGRVKNYKEHPIKKMFHEGMKVTINSDDCLIFDQSVTDEYVNLFKAGTLSAYELEQIRKYGLEKGNVLEREESYEKNRTLL